MIDLDREGNRDRRPEMNNEYGSHSSEDDGKPGDEQGENTQGPGQNPEGKKE